MLARFRVLLAKIEPTEWKALTLILPLSAIFIHDWDGYVFRTAVTELWHFKSPYTTGASSAWFTLLGPLDEHSQWWAYPPLALFMMAITYAPALLFSMPPFVGRILLKLPQLFFHFFLARAASKFGRNPTEVSQIQKLFLWNPLLILVGPIWGMTDGIMMAFLLQALLSWRANRLSWTGLWLGLAILVKPFPVFLAIPLLPLVIRRDSWRGLGKIAGTTAYIGLLVCAPFLLFDGRNFLNQVAGTHLARASQGITFWRWPLISQLPPMVIIGASVTLLSIGLMLVTIWVARRKREHLDLFAVALAGLVFLLTNRVVNEQYIVMAVVPLLLLGALSLQAVWPATWLSRATSISIVFIGFHFLTFLPPDIAMLLLRRPEDEVAYILQSSAPWIWTTILVVILGAVPLLLGASLLRTLQVKPQLRIEARQVVIPLGIAILLAFGSIGSATAEEEPINFVPSTLEPSIFAYYYLWWNNPSHDPEVQYGNWRVVSQSPEIGYYTNNVGIAKIHAEQMVASGVDTAIISYHRGEEARYQVFQKAALEAGLWTTPLIELNQVYDMVVNGARIHRPVNERGEEASYAAYRMTTASKLAIVDFILAIAPELQAKNAATQNGAPMIMFYDSYVSGISFEPEDRLNLAEALLATMSIEELRIFYNDPMLEATPESILKYHPESYSEFFQNPLASVWRQAHINQTSEFWQDIQDEVESQIGKLTWIAGDAYNERAGFEAGIVQSISQLETFDGAFIYSPSFTWGTNQDKSHQENLALNAARNQWMIAFANGAGKSSMPGIAPAYDDTVNRPKIGFVIPAEFQGRSTYDLQWETMIASGATHFGIATWNEYFEGSSIEPSIEFGSKFLDSTSAWAKRVQARSSPDLNVTVVMHETSARLRAGGAENEQAHGWGLSLISAAFNAFQGANISALDALNPIQTSSILNSDIVLIDGAWGVYQIHPDILAASKLSRSVIFTDGPLNLGIPCQDTQYISGGLVPGDKIENINGKIALTRDGTSYLIGEPNCNQISMRVYEDVAYGLHSCLATIIGSNPLGRCEF